MAPKYAFDGLFSTKSDVFSFGIILLEIVSGKRNRGLSNQDHNLNLVGYVSFNDFQFLLRMLVLEFRIAIFGLIFVLL
jgi:hypothetical protein